MQEANPFTGRVALDGADVDPNRPLTERYASSPEPPIPVWITYHWKVFRAREETARLTVSDWPGDEPPAGAFGQEQTFKSLEIQPYHD